MIPPKRTNSILKGVNHIRRGYQIVKRGADLLFSALLIACEVAFIRLYPKYCQGLKETEKYAILTGLDVVETEAYNEEDN